MILLTGGSGFIGSHFHQYIPADNLVNFDLVPPQFHESLHFIQGDIRKKEDLVNAVSRYKIKTIISLAAKHHDFGIGHDEYFDTNEDGTRIICDVATEYGINDIIFYSSVAVYGIRDVVSTERLDPQPDSPYGASKLAGERVLQQWAAQDSSRKVLIIRPTVVYGPNNTANMYSLIRQIDSGLYFHLGAANNIKSIAFVKNLVEATLFLRDRLKNGVAIYNYADEPQLTSRQISSTIAAALSKRIRLTLPKTIGVLLSLPFDLVIRLTKKNLPISSSRVKKLSTETHHSAKKLFDEGFTPKFSTIEGLKIMVDWYRSQQRS